MWIMDFVSIRDGRFGCLEGLWHRGVQAGRMDGRLLLAIVNRTLRYLYSPGLRCLTHVTRERQRAVGKWLRSSRKTSLVLAHGSRPGGL